MDQIKDSEIITIDVIIPSIRLDPKKLLNMLQINIPQNIRLCWYIVIDNQSLESMDFTHNDHPVHVIVNSDNLGAPLSRNVGLDMGNSDYVFFLDDDIIPEPDILLHYLDAIKSEPNASGYVGPTQFPNPTNSFTRGICASGILTFFDLEKNRDWMSWATTSNIMIRRKNVGDIRFSSKFPKHGGGEDVDFCLHIIANQQKWFKTVPKASVKHGWWRNSCRSYKRFFRWAFGDSLLTKIHPQYKYYSCPNMIEMLFFSPLILACLLTIELISLNSIIFSIGAIISSEFIVEQFRTRLANRNYSLLDGFEATLVRLSSDLGHFWGPLCHKDIKGIFARFDYFSTRELISMERKITAIKFTLSSTLILLCSLLV